MTYEEKYKRWAEKLKSLDDHIRGLKNWDDYAVSCQNEYDWLLKQKPLKGDAEDLYWMELARQYDMWKDEQLVKDK